MTNKKTQTLNLETEGDNFDDIKIFICLSHIFGYQALFLYLLLGLLRWAHLFIFVQGSLSLSVGFGTTMVVLGGSMNCQVNFST